MTSQANTLQVDGAGRVIKDYGDSEERQSLLTKEEE
jgi:hypothetical protein